MPIGEEDYSSNLPALGRFKPGYVSGGAGQDELKVTLETNLAGEPIRFTFNESLDNIVSSGTLTMLNAIIGDDGEQQDGVMGEVKTEEDEAKWGTLYDAAPVEPNQLCWVKESGGGLGECTTYWRVVGVTSYLDENNIPYYEVQLEGMGQIAIDTKFDPEKAGGAEGNDVLVIINKDVWEDAKEQFQVDADNDGYILPEEEPKGINEIDLVLNSAFNGSRLIASTPSEWLKPFLAQIEDGGLDCGGAVDIGEWTPAFRFYKAGESCWAIIEDMFAFAGKMIRFNREKRLVVLDVITGPSGETGWSYAPSGLAENNVPIYDQDDVDNPPLQTTDIGDFGIGLQLTYSKDGVYNWAYVTGWIVNKNEDDKWELTSTEPTKIKVFSKAGDNILNGQKVILTVEVSADYGMLNNTMLENYGLKELYKSVIGARSAVYDSETVPLDVEVGMIINGDSKLGGATSIFITALSRTTDAQQGRITTGISGTRVFIGESTDNNMGWE